MPDESTPQSAQPLGRRLATILCADIADYSKMMASTKRYDGTSTTVEKKKLVCSICRHEVVGAVLSIAFHCLCSIGIIPS